MNKRFLMYLIFSILSYNSISQAEPNVLKVDGNFSNGSNLVITGTDFGSHQDNNLNRDYLALGWENFETGTADSIFTANYGPELETNTALQKSNSNYAAKGYAWSTARAYTNVWGATKNASTMYGFHLSLPAKEKKIFMSGWFMFPDGFDTGISYHKEIIDQTKFMCMTPIGSATGKTYFVTRRGANTIPVMTSTEDGHLAEGDNDTLFNYAPMGTWHRFDIYVDLTKPEGQKIHNWYIDGKKLPRINDFYNSDAMLTKAGVIDGFNYLSWLTYQFVGDDTYTWFQYMDDAFADLTQARVEISESPIWDETIQTHKEIQIPLSWNNNTITIQLNLGSIAKEKALYLYVIDDEGNVNLKGRPVNAPIPK